MLSAKPSIPNLVHRFPHAADRSRPRSLLSPVGDTPPPASGECLVGLSMTRSCAQGHPTAPARAPNKVPLPRPSYYRRVAIAPCLDALPLITWLHVLTLPHAAIGAAFLPSAPPAAPHD